MAESDGSGERPADGSHAATVRAPVSAASAVRVAPPSRRLLPSGTALAPEGAGQVASDAEPATGIPTGPETGRSDVAAEPVTAGLRDAFRAPRPPRGSASAIRPAGASPPTGPAPTATAPGPAPVGAPAPAATLSDPTSGGTVAPDGRTHSNRADAAGPKRPRTPDRPASRRTAMQDQPVATVSAKAAAAASDAAANAAAETAPPNVPKLPLATGSVDGGTHDARAHNDATAREPTPAPPEPSTSAPSPREADNRFAVRPDAAFANPSAPLAAPSVHAPSVHAPAVHASEDATAAVPRKAPLIVITGASGGIGAALAARIARPGLSVALIGRNPDGLDRARAAVEQRGGRAITSRIDLTTSAFEHWIDSVADRFAITALYANAGLSAGPRSVRELESVDDTERLVRTNLLGTIMTVRAVVERMRRQPAGKRRIGIVASVAGLLPTPDLAVYAATKAGLVAYAHALRPRLAGDEITVTVLCPGFVTSPMSARHHGAKPFEISAEQAARRIVAATEAGRRTVVFPLPYAVLAWLAPLAPGALIDRLTQNFRADIAPDPRVEPTFTHRRLDRPRPLENVEGE